MIRRIDFLDGAVKEVSEEALSKGRVLDVRWRGNVHFVLQTYHSDWGWYFAERNGERVSSLYRVGRFDERFYQAVWQFVGEINQGDFGHKRTASERLGFALFFHNFSTFLGRAGIYLEDLFVKPEYRGKGYGKVILKKLAVIAVERGCGRLEWWCLDWNKPGIDFYLSLGAEPMDDWTVYRITGDTLSNLASF